MLLSVKRAGGHICFVTQKSPEQRFSSAFEVMKHSQHDATQFGIGLFDQFVDIVVTVYEF